LDVLVGCESPDDMDGTLPTDRLLTIDRWGRPAAAAVGDIAAAYGVRVLSGAGLAGAPRHTVDGGLGHDTTPDVTAAGSSSSSRAR